MSDDSSIFAEVQAERAKQDSRWGGPAHDDTHSLREWFIIISTYLSKAWDNQNNVAVARRRLVQIAALAFAAIEALDRKNDTSNRSAG